MDDLSNDVYKITARILRILNNTKNTPKTRAIMANIRDNTQRSDLNNIQALSFVFSNIPTELVGYGKNLNDYEKSILTAIELYSIHQQSRIDSVLKLDYDENEWRQNIGDSLSVLRNEDSKSIDQRFNAMVNSTTFEELKNHLRQLIKILKSKSEVKVDYASLAEDLFWFLKNQKEGIKIKWARSYYKYRQQNKKGND